MPEVMPSNIPKGKAIGKITHFFGKIGVAVIKATDGVKVGDTIVISGHGKEKEFEQTIDSLQVDHKPVQEIKAGEEAGMKVEKDAKDGSIVYLKG